MGHPGVQVGGTYRAQRHVLSLKCEMAPTPSTRAHHTLGGVVSHVLRGERACSQLKTGADEGRDALLSAGFHVNREVSVFLFLCQSPRSSE